MEAPTASLLHLREWVAVALPCPLRWVAALAEAAAAAAAAAAHPRPRPCLVGVVVALLLHLRCQAPVVVVLLRPRPCPVGVAAVALLLLLRCLAAAVAAGRLPLSRSPASRAGRPRLPCPVSPVRLFEGHWVVGKCLACFDGIFCNFSFVLLQADHPLEARAAVVVAVVVTIGAMMTGATITIGTTTVAADGVTMMATMAGVAAEEVAEAAEVMAEAVTPFGRAQSKLAVRTAVVMPEFDVIRHKRR